MSDFLIQPLLLGISTCPNSKELAIGRQGYMIYENNLVDGKCPDGEEIPGIWR